MPLWVCHTSRLVMWYARAEVGRSRWISTLPVSVADEKGAVVLVTRESRVTDGARLY